MLKSETFTKLVAKECRLQDGVKCEFIEILFQPVPWSPSTTRGMPQEFERCADDPDYTIINIPPTVTFNAKIFNPSRLCAIYKKMTVRSGAAMYGCGILSNGVDGLERFYCAGLFVAFCPFCRHRTEVTPMSEMQVTNAGVSTTTPAPLEIDVPATHDDAAGNSRVILAVRLSALANIILFAAKLFAFIVSGSQAVLASLADSGVDLASQLVVFFCNSRTRKVDPKYPIGKTRLETVGALIIACIMTFAAVLVIQSAAEDLAAGFRSDDPPVPKMGAAVYAIIALAISLKACLFVVCFLFRSLSDSTLVLAQDHKNDVLSNVVVVIAATVATSFGHKYWYVDPIGGICISLFIIVCWMILADNQIAKIVGLSAPKDFRDKIHDLASRHDGILEVDAIRAYHLGLKFFVEIDVVMPGSMPLFNSHDAALGLQKKVENMDEVERAFVHVDYEKRESPEHKLDWSMR